MNIQSSFTVYTAALHALILIIFSLHTSGLGYPGLTWIYCISTNKSFSSPKTSSRTPYSNSKQQEKQKHSAETTINFSSLVVSHPKTPILNCFYHLLWFYFLTVSEFSCLAKS